MLQYKKYWINDKIETYGPAIVVMFAPVFRTAFFWVIVIFAVQFVIVMVAMTPKNPNLILNIISLGVCGYFTVVAFTTRELFNLDYAFIALCCHFFFMHIQYLKLMRPYILRNPSLWTGREYNLWNKKKTQ